MTVSNKALLAGLRVLVVDDFASMRALLLRMVAELGAEGAESADNGEDAIALLAAAPVDVVLCDYNLGEGRTGQQVLEEARCRNLLGYASVYIMITAETLASMVLGAIEHQPDEYLVKPFVKEVLLLRLQRAIERKRDLRPLDALLRGGDYSGALNLCHGIAERDPARLHDMQKLRAELYIGMSDYDNAAAEYEQALTQREFPWARFGLGRVRTLQARYPEAREIFEQLIAANKRYTEAYDWLARVLAEQGEAAAAQRTLEAAVAISPRSVRRQRLLGESALRLGQHDVAERAFQAAIQQGHGSSLSEPVEFLALAQLAGRKGTPEAALQLLLQAATVFAGEPAKLLSVSAERAQLHQQLGDSPAAGQALDVVLSLAGAAGQELPAATAVAMAQLCFTLGRQQAGMSMMQSAVRSAHDDAATLQQARAAFAQAGMQKEGEALIERERGELVAVNNRGVALFEQHRLDEAMELFIRAAEGLPQNRTVNLNAARILLFAMRGGGVTPMRVRHVRKFLERARPAAGDHAEYDKAMQTFRGILSGAAGGRT